MSYPQQPPFMPSQDPYASQHQGYAPPQAPAPYFPPQAPQYPAPQAFPHQGNPYQTGYAAPQQAPAPPPPPKGTIKEFWEQPSSGGPALQFPHPGTEYTGVVVRDVTNADIEAQTDIRTGEIRKHPDGRVKQHMKVPLAIPPSPQYPEGFAVWYVKGADQSELVRAMQAAGCENDADGNPPVPRMGDVIHIRFTHERPGRQGMNPTKIRQVTYTKGNGQPPQATLIAQPMPPAPAQQYAQGQGSQYTQNGQWGQAPQPPAFQGTIPPEYSYGYQQATVGAQPTFQTPQQPDPALAYQQATGQPMQQPGPYGQPQAEWNPYAQQPQQYQQAPPTPAPSVPAAPPSGPVPPSGAPSPSNGAAPPADWPAGVPFMPGLTPKQAELAASMAHPVAGPPQQ
jgi:hypothetical protein